MGSPSKQIPAHSTVIQYADTVSPPAENPARAFMIEGDGTGVPQVCNLNLADNTTVTACLAPGVLHHITVVSVTGGNTGLVTYFW